MAEAIVLHLLYIVGAVLLYRWLSRRLIRTSPFRRRIVTSGLLALLFSPGLFWSFPFAVPTFALLALIVQLLSVVSNGDMFLVPQMVFTFVPMLVSWFLVFSVAHLVASARSRKEAPHA